MADIPIERKDHKSIWPWIIGIIVLLIILWFLLVAIAMTIRPRRPVRTRR